MNEREAFEAWCLASPTSQFYCNSWVAWQARAALAQPTVPHDSTLAQNATALPVAVEVRGMLANGVEIPLSVRGVYELRDGKTGVFVHMPDADEQPPAPLTLTQDQIMEYVREAGLDWHRGWIMGEPPVNRYEEFARAILAAAQEGKP